MCSPLDVADQNQGGRNYALTDIVHSITFSEKVYSNAIHIGTDADVNFIAHVLRANDTTISYFSTNSPVGQQTLLYWIAVGR